MELEPDWLPSITGFELCEPVDPFVGGADAVGVVDGVQEGVRVGIVFGGLGDRDAVGSVLGEGGMSASACSIGPHEGPALYDVAHPAARRPRVCYTPYGASLEYP